MGIRVRIAEYYQDATSGKTTPSVITSLAQCRAMLMTRVLSMSSKEWIFTKLLMNTLKNRRRQLEKCSTESNDLFEVNEMSCLIDY